MAVVRPTPPSVASTPGNTKADTPSITTQTPDNVIGETLVVQGRVEFKNLLRIDGHFEGESTDAGHMNVGVFVSAPTAKLFVSAPTANYRR